MLIWSSDMINSVWISEEIIISFSRYVILIFKVHPADYQSDCNDMTEHSRSRIWMNLTFLDHITTLGVCGNTMLDVMVIVHCVWGDTMLDVMDVVLMFLRDWCTQIVIVTGIVITTHIQLSSNATIWYFPQLIMAVLVRSFTIQCFQNIPVFLQNLRYYEWTPVFWI